MQLDRQSAVILSFPRDGSHKAFTARSGKFAGLADRGRLANLGFLALVLGLAALWLTFPPAQLSDEAGGVASRAVESAVAQNAASATR